MKKVAWWLIAIIITVSTAVYQRLTGPTYPLEGKVTLNNSVISYSLARSHEGMEDHEVSITVENIDIKGHVFFKRHKTADMWTTLPMLRKENSLVASLPHQPPAGKLEYKVILTYKEKEVSLSGEKPAIIRFKDRVPGAILIPHIIIMFLAMLISNRAGIEALQPRDSTYKYAILATGLLFIGGMVLGPLVQKYAFGVYWTGFPLGYDLTDNKTLIAFIGWLVALIAGRKKRQARWWILGAAILLLVVYLIPHSLLGSEFDYSEMNPSTFP
ncbi:MAG: hypothetical protein ACETWK_03020 [Candidatus Aminicenantaceae bacterium]